MFAIATKLMDGTIDVLMAPSSDEFNAALVGMMRSPKVGGPGPQQGELVILHHYSCSVFRAPEPKPDEHLRVLRPQPRPLHSVMQGGLIDTWYTFVPVGATVLVGGEVWHWDGAEFTRLSDDRTTIAVPSTVTGA